MNCFVGFPALLVSRKIHLRLGKLLSMPPGLRAHDAPVAWQRPSNPTLVEVYFARRWAESAASLLDAQTRVSRIKNWKKKMKEAAHGSCKFIYHHLKNRAQDETPNLVLDDQGNIIYQPELALDQINQAWDGIYVANALCEHPLKVLEVEWPQIHDKAVQLHLPPIKGKQLFVRKGLPLPSTKGSSLSYPLSF